MGIERARRTDLPIGTVTFLRTDVEGSMGLARRLGPRWDDVNAEHLDLIRRAVDRHGGICVRTEGDALFGVFPEAGAAVTAAIDAQRALAAHTWPADALVRVRMGLHSGEAHLAGDDYGGFEVNRAARVAAAGHGGQVILSEPTRLLAEAVLTDGVAVRDLGRHVLRDVPAPERLFQLDVPGLRTDFPPLRTSRPSVGNLPVRLTSFLGRDRELQELRDLLESSRLVTLTGPGGIGKSSLAIELGRSLADTVPDGAWFVALDEISDPGLVTATIARSIGLFDGPQGAAKEGLARYLADRSVLLVLDNFEHLLEAAGDVGVLLRASPGSRIVVTSRAPLRIAGEQEYPVRPLAVDGGACSALFTQRARAVRPGWDAGADSAVVDEICGLLDGLPLGLELAAARVSLLPVRAIRDRLAARIPLPGTGPRDVPDRQRTLDRAIAWSHELLDAGDRRLLHELSVFEGSFDVDQAAAVSGPDVLDHLATLVDQSLVVRVADDDTGVRFRLLQTIRSFAAARLVEDGREPELRRRHAEAYLALAEKAAPNLPGADMPRILRRLAADEANLRQATRWAIDAGDTTLALRLVAALWRFWQMDGHLAEGRTLTEAALAMPGADEPTRARMGAVTAAGGIAYWDGRTAEATRLYAEEESLARELGDPVAEADAAFNLVFVRFLTGDVEGASAAVDAVIAQFRALGDERGVARANWGRGTMLLQQGDIAAAEATFLEYLAEFRRLRDVWYESLALGSLAWVTYQQGRVPEAGAWLAEGFAKTYALRDISAWVIGLPAFALIAIEAGRFEDAATLLAALDAFRIQYSMTVQGGLAQLVARANPLERIESALSPEQLAAARDRGRRMTLAEAADLVRNIAEPFAQHQ